MTRLEESWDGEGVGHQKAGLPVHHQEVTSDFTASPGDLWAELSHSRPECCGLTARLAFSFFLPLGHCHANPSTWVWHPDSTGQTCPFFMAQLKDQPSGSHWQGLVLLSLFMVLWFRLHDSILNDGFCGRGVATLACVFPTL